MKYLERVDSDKPVSRIGLGTWQFGSREWGYGDAYSSQDAARIVARAVDVGITVFDTAEAYGFGRSERILGAALAAHAAVEGSFIATKLFPVFPIGCPGAQGTRRHRGRGGSDRAVSSARGEACSGSSRSGRCCCGSAATAGRDR